MNKILALYLCIISVLLFITVHGIEYEIPDDFLADLTYDLDPLTRAIKPTAGKNCTKPGFMCEDCKNVSICIQISGGWIKEEADQCLDGQTCLESTGQCTSGSNPSCDGGSSDYKFLCHQEGFLPDPFNCKDYYMCLENDDGVVDPTPIQMSCDGIYYYNSRTTLCSKRLYNNTCPIIGNPCKDISSQGPISDNPTMYYVCLKAQGSSKYYPQLFICPNNQEFNELTTRCEDPTPQGATGSDGKCKVKGLFYDPTNCFYYYECTGAGVNPIRRLCSNKMYFHHKSQKCADFTCKNLDKD